MEMGAGMCAAVGPSGAGGFERRSTHSVKNLVSSLQRRGHAEELVFAVEPEMFLRQCEGQGARV